MTEARFGGSRPPLSAAEESVLHALEKLPVDYQIVAGPQIQVPSVPGGESAISYEPDFEILGPEGKRVVIEVKTSRSLSMVNLSRFLKFNNLIHATGREFLVLVWDEDRFSDSLRAIPEFKTLNIRSVQNHADVINAVKSEFRKPKI